MDHLTVILVLNYKMCFLGIKLLVSVKGKKESLTNDQVSGYV